MARYESELVVIHQTVFVQVVIDSGQQQGFENLTDGAELRYRAVAFKVFSLRNLFYYLYNLRGGYYDRKTGVYAVDLLQCSGTRSPARDRYNGSARSGS
ncbi:hypothetical protein Trydic_g17547 [Trypoxylus dichotomus]